MAREAEQPSASDHARALTTGAVVLAVRPPIGKADIPDLCEQLAALLRESGAAVVICDVAAVTEVDAVMVDLVARLQLTAMRLGRRLRLRQPSGRLVALLTLTGLRSVVAIQYGSGLEACRQPEQREQPLGVEERVDPDDPSA